jgi:signal transduction histidine kinase
MLGVLRHEEGGSAQPGQHGAGPAPVPGLADLVALVQRAAEAGVQVTLTVNGERPELSAGMDLAVYRVVQEAVTNVIKHAATGRCRVTIAYRPDLFTVQVTDEGRGVVDPAPGHGIVGMRERVGMYGGEFRAGPLPGRGFQVTATFPLTTADAR